MGATATCADHPHRASPWRLSSPPRPRLGAGPASPCRPHPRARLAAGDLGLLAPHQP